MISSQKSKLSNLNNFKIGGSSSKPIILGELSVIGKFADSFGFQEDPPILKLFKDIQVSNFHFLLQGINSKIAKK